MAPLPLPRIGAPATRALNAAGHADLARLVKVTEEELLSLHGVGPKAIRVLKEALAEHNLAFKK